MSWISSILQVILLAIFFFFRIPCRKNISHQAFICAITIASERFALNSNNALDLTIERIQSIFTRWSKNQLTGRRAGLLNELTNNVCRKTIRDSSKSPEDHIRGKKTRPWLGYISNLNQVQDSKWCWKTGHHVQVCVLSAVGVVELP